MAHSISFNDTDMGAYDLVVVSSGINPISQLVGRVQLQDNGYVFQPVKMPRRIKTDFVVTGTTRADLDSSLDTIKNTLMLPTDPKKLIFDTFVSRYFNAMLESLSGEYLSATRFNGRLIFICPDPLGYSISEDSNDHNIDSDPKTIEEVVGGTGYVNPVYTLEAGEGLDAVTIKLENLTTDEELQWTGSLANGEVLVVNVASWLVTKEGAADMGTVTGKFPRLVPGATNEIKVTAFAASGSLNITYRDTYL